MTPTEALAVKARGLTKEQIIAHLRAVAENNLRADIRTIASICCRWRRIWVRPGISSGGRRFLQRNVTSCLICTRP